MEKVEIRCAYEPDVAKAEIEGTKSSLDVYTWDMDKESPIHVVCLDLAGAKKLLAVVQAWIDEQEGGR